MLNARWMTVQELQKEKLHPAFEDGLNIFLNEIGNNLTVGTPKVTIRLEEIDGGRGSGG